MVKNSNISGNVTSTTAKYKLVTDTLMSGFLRLQADREYFRVLLRSKNPNEVKQGRNGVTATNIQMARQKAAITLDQRENIAAFNRGEIFKFW